MTTIKSLTLFFQKKKDITMYADSSGFYILTSTVSK